MRHPRLVRVDVVGGTAAGPRGTWRAPVAIAAIALLVRLTLVLRSPGGLTGLYSYDPGVYYAAGDALVHGRLPYRDFVFLHPPAVMLTTAPFALFGSLTSDEIGFVAANCAFMCAGAANAALVVVAGRRLGLPERAARIGGAVYAVWIGAAGAETSVRLEPLGTLMFLACLVFVAPAAVPLGRGSALLGGVFAGIACTVKIWWCVPVLVVAAWLGLRSRRRALVLRFAIGIGCGLAALIGPFFAMAPTTMWRMVVTDQLSRARSSSLLTRAFEITGIRAILGTDGTASDVVLGVVAVACVVLAVACWRSRIRLPLALVSVQLAVLAAAPTFFGFYVNYAAASAALVVAGGSTVRVGARWARIAVLAGSSAGWAYALAAGGSVTSPFPASRLAAGVADARCVMADSPDALIELDALSRGLAAGCPNWVDVSGLTHDRDRVPAARTRNARWQADALRYLRSGDAVILVRPATGLTSTTRVSIQGDCVLAEAGRYRVYRTSEHEQPALPPAACEASLDADDHGTTVH